MAINPLLIVGILAIVVIGGVVVYLAVPATPSGTTTTVAPAGPPGPPNATPANLAAWISGQFGSAPVFAGITGGMPPYTCTLGKGSVLPTGLALNGDCTVTGTHILASGTTHEISPPFTVVVSDSASPAASRSYQVSITTVLEKPTFIPVTGQCVVGQQCHTQVATATGGVPPYTFSPDSLTTAAPMGLVVGVDGFLTGTPNTAGTFNFNACVSDTVRAEDCGQTGVVVSSKGNQVANQTTNQTKMYKWAGTIKGTRYFTGFNLTTGTGSDSCPGGGSLEAIYNINFSAPAGLIVHNSNGSASLNSSFNDETFNGTISGGESVVKQCGEREVNDNYTWYLALNGGDLESLNYTISGVYGENLTLNKVTEGNLGVGFFFETLDGSTIQVVTQPTGELMLPNFITYSQYRYSYGVALGWNSTIENSTVVIGPFDLTSISDTRMSGSGFFSATFPLSLDSGSFTVTLTRQN